MSMYRGKIENAKREAEDFIGTCNEALARLDKENERVPWGEPRDKPRQPSIADYSFGSAETGALRRKSMDLTRTLAELRK
jgi:hypothetical protein